MRPVPSQSCLRGGWFLGQIVSGGEVLPCRPSNCVWNGRFCPQSREGHGEGPAVGGRPELREAKLAEQPLHRGVLQRFQSLRESRRADVENQELRVTGRLGQVHLTRQERPRGGRRPRHRVRWLQLGGSAGRTPRGSVLAAD